MYNVGTQEENNQPRECVVGFERLWREHYERLKKSAILDEVIARRGYFSVENRASAKRLGFKAGAGAGLMTPLYGVLGRGRVTSGQLKPDVPRPVRDKIRKYENMPGRPNCLDVHPSQMAMVGDPSIPAWINEGVFKGDAMVSIGAFAINMTGVGNWRGKNEFDAAVALPDWEMIAIAGRTFILAFDEDLLTNEQVHKMLRRLEKFLLAQKAKCVLHLDWESIREAYANGIH